jgi:hypothetical protein
MKILLFLALFCTLSCDSFSQKVKVQTIKLAPNSYRVGNTDTLFEQKIFNKFGSLVKHTVLEDCMQCSKKTDSIITIYKYDVDNRMLSFTKILNEKEKDTKLFKYNKIGLLTQKIAKNNNTIYYYDSIKRLHRKDFINFFTKYTYWYDTTKLCLTTLMLDSTTNEKHIAEKKVYDNYNRLIFHYLFENKGDTALITSYEYNILGNILKIKNNYFNESYRQIINLNDPLEMGCDSIEYTYNSSNYKIQKKIFRDDFSIIIKDYIYKDKLIVSEIISNYDVINNKRINNINKISFEYMGKTDLVKTKIIEINGIKATYLYTYEFW